MIVAAVVEAACGTLDIDLNQPIAIVVTVPDSVEQQDTLRGHATELTAAGDTVTETVIWSSLDTTLLGVLDSTAGKFLGKRPGFTQILARTGSLRSGSLTITIDRAADTLYAAGATSDTITLSTHDSVSAPLAVTLADTVTGATPPTVALPNRRVVFTIAAAPTGATVSIVPDNVSHAIAALDTVLTDANGTATVRLRYLSGGTLPDSARVTATARRAVGTTVPGSPITFVIRIQP